jgi:hypothetical protein
MLADDAYFLLALTLSMVLTSFLTLCFASLFFFMKDYMLGRPNIQRTTSPVILQNYIIFKRDRVDWIQEGF